MSDTPALATCRAPTARGGVAEIVARADLFKGFTPAAAEAAMQLLEGPIHLPPRQTVFAQGDAGDRMYLVVSGRLKLSQRAADGREHLLALLGPSDVFGELAIFDPGPRTVTATTMSSSALMSMNRATLRAWIRGHPELAERMLGTLARQLRRTEDDLSYLGSACVAERLAAQLLALAERFGTANGNTVTVAHGLTQDEIAQLVGSSRETVSKVLIEFGRRGWIRVVGRSVTIVNTQRLMVRARCPSSPAASWAITA